MGKTKEKKEPAKKAQKKEKPEVKKDEKKPEEEHVEAVEVVRQVVEKEPQQQVTELNELQLDRPKIELLKRTIAKGATDDELLMFINVCRGLGLSPFLKHVHLVKRWDSKLKQEVATVQVGIDGFRSIAEETGAYAGNDDPVFEGEIEVGKAKVPEKATVTVRKVVQGTAYDFTASARWDEFFPGDKLGFMWKSKPHLMLGKCAEAQALRKAFPKVLAGVYVPEELEKEGGLKSPEELAEGKFSKAKAMIEKTDKPDGLRDFLERLEESDVYTKAQKNQLKKAVESRLGELAEKAPAEKVIDIEA